MKAITKHINIYSLKELVELEAKGEMKRACQKAREWLQEGATGHDNWWCEHTIETWESALKQLGFNDPKIWFSGFWSQGDGACFDATVDIEVLVGVLSNTKIKPTDVITYNGKTEDFRGWAMKKCGGFRTNPKFKKLLEEEFDLSASIEKNVFGNHYSHSRTRYLSIDYSVYHVKPKQVATIHDMFKSFELAAEELRYSLSNAIYKDLEEEYYWRQADEQLIEDAEANKWMFNEDGEREDE